MKLKFRFAYKALRLHSEWEGAARTPQRFPMKPLPCVDATVRGSLSDHPQPRATQR
ncbi:hypothetical protein [Azospirillum sp. TSO35-2]|uniref:hypothetical protein n=1 Tax=Azospirillum sp. TSO35-2 TaxID=716796 RepID=UPI001304C01E|nr:hypothetical protein [Azospirillum sp. TSO35-2]